jgi:hypothetical protein
LAALASLAVAEMGVCCRYTCHKKVPSAEYKVQSERQKTVDSRWLRFAKSLEKTKAGLQRRQSQF